MKKALLILGMIILGFFVYLTNSAVIFTNSYMPELFSYTAAYDRTILSSKSEFVSDVIGLKKYNNAGVKKYTDEWFAKNDLIIVTANMSTSSGKYYLNKLTYGQYEIDIKISCKTPSSVSCDMASKVIFIEVKKQDAPKWINVSFI